MEVSVIDLLKQMAIAVPSIMVGTQAITAAIHGAFKITKSWLVHLISWVVSIGGAECFVALNGLTFGLGGWDYAIGAVCGVIVGACANGVYDWKGIKKIFDAITNLFGKKDKKEE